MKSILPIIAFLCLSFSVMSQSIGSKVKLFDASGKNYTGVITNIRDGKYQVKYDGYEFSAWLNTTQFVVSSAPARQQANQPVQPAQTTQTNNQKMGGGLYMGEYATYGYGGGAHIISGMGFFLLQGGTYYDLAKGRGGKYTYNPGAATISFHGGFLDGQTGTKVIPNGGFWLSSTVYSEPWK